MSDYATVNVNTSLYLFYQHLTGAFITCLKNENGNLIFVRFHTYLW